MAGVSLKVDFQDKEILRLLEELEQRGSNMQPVLEKIGEHLVESTEQRFADQEDPEGNPWKPLSESYRARKKKHQDLILVLREHLSGRLAYRAGKTRVRVGSNLRYAATHQFGASKGDFGKTESGLPIPFGDIPARPFLGISSADEAKIVGILKDYLTP